MGIRKVVAKKYEVKALFGQNDSRDLWIEEEIERDMMGTVLDERCFGRCGCIVPPLTPKAAVLKHTFRFRKEKGSRARPTHKTPKNYIGLSLKFFLRALLASRLLGSSKTVASKRILYGLLKGRRHTKMGGTMEQGIGAEMQSEGYATIVGREGGKGQK